MIMEAKGSFIILMEWKDQNVNNIRIQENLLFGL